MTLSMFYACKFSGWYFSGMAHRLLSKAFCASFHITSPTEMAHFLDHRLGVQFWPSQAVYGGRWGLYRSDHLLNFFLFPFCKQSWIYMEGKSMTPRRGNNFLLRSSQQLPCPSVSLEGLFELTRRLTRAHDLPCALLPELQRYKTTFRCGALG